MNEAVAGGTEEVGALGGDAVPGPLEHLDNDGLVRGRGASHQGVFSEERTALSDGAKSARDRKSSKLEPSRHEEVQLRAVGKRVGETPLAL